MSPGKYKVLRLTGPRSFSIGTAEVDQAPEGGLLAEVIGCAICGTDLKIFRGAKKVASDVLGHEFVARIVGVGEGVQSFEVGQRITVATTVSCGRCWYCQEGLTNLCENAVRMSLDFPGAFAEIVRIPATVLRRGNVLKVPENLPSDIAVLAEPLSCVLNGQQIAGMRPGLDVLVVGAGPIGMLHVQAARHCGARRIILSEISGGRLKLAAKSSADVCLDPTRQDLAKRVKAETEGMGVDLAIVCSPSSKAIQGLLGMLRKRGTLSIFAGLSADDSDFPLDARMLHYGELSVTGASDSRPDHFALAMRMLEAFPDSFRPLVTHTFPLEKAMEAFEILERGEGLKVVLVPGGAS